MQAMLPCIACKRHAIEDDDEDEDEDDYTGGRNNTITKAEVKSLSSQLKDVVLKVSAAYRQCRPCAGSKGKTFEHEFVIGNSDASSSEDQWIQKSGILKKENYPSSAASSISEGAVSVKQDDQSSSKVSPSSQASSNSSSGSAAKNSSSKQDHLDQHNERNCEETSQEWVAQVEPGVLITFIAMPNGENELKRIRFSRELFNKWQAEAWWAENCERVHELYNVSGNDHSFPNSQKDQVEAQTSQQNHAEVTKSNTTSDELTEWVEEDEPGVYITVKLGPNGNRELKRVRFSREKFSERQAKLWWERNRFRIHDNYL
ncbi:protein Brevis radix-like 1 [Selaginella moellendorffii]|nr:protein Brevis radix-like 1 [Selaginella moellendorffii]|eukprot:XP_002984996.2 protein Brevis radix-like 1 [Selaginella moellendorffii]